MRAMSDEELEAFLQSALARLSDADFEQACREHPELRSIYEGYRNAP
jgi:ribosomal protein L29